MDRNKVFAFVGMTGAGKTTASDYLTQKGFLKVYFGSMILNELGKRNLEITPENEKEVLTELRALHGHSMCAKYFLGEILCKLQINNVVIDGLYSWSEYLYLKNFFGDALIIVCITLDKQLRYQRLFSRPERYLTPEKAQMRDIREIETIEKGGPIAYADYYILNNGSLKELLDKLDQLIKEVL